MGTQGFAQDLMRRTPLRRRAKKDKREHDKPYLAWIHTQPCLVCGRVPVEAHHACEMRYGFRPPDRRGVPLCRVHHSRDSKASIHVLGKRFGPTYGIDVEAEIVQLNGKYDSRDHVPEVGNMVCAVSDCA